MLAFFAVIIAADATMIYKALTTFGGVDNPNAYRQGVAYNQRIARDAEQTLIGWHDDIEVVGSPERLRVSLRDRAAARRRRPEGRTQRSGVRLPIVSMRRSTSPRSRPGDMRPPLPRSHEGTWIVDLSVYAGGASTEPLYQMRRRVWIKP